LAKQLLKIFDRHRPDYFHQLGWMPLTPLKVIKKISRAQSAFGARRKMDVWIEENLCSDDFLSASWKGPENTNFLPKGGTRI